MVDIAATIGKLGLRNPTILASGVRGETGESLLAMARAGAGAIVTKSIGLEPRMGHANPTFLETESGIINAMGLPNPGIQEYESEMKIALTGEIPVIGSIFGGNEEEFRALAVKMEDYGAEAVELNLSCPHAKGYGIELGHDINEVEKITRRVKETIKIPVFVKLSPNTPDIVKLAMVVEKAEGDGVVAVNTLRAMAINAEIGRPNLANSIGGLSGPAIKPVGLRCVYEIAGEIDLPVIGVGGIRTGEDAIEYIMAGASAVQIGSGVFYEGDGIFTKVCQEIKDFMIEHGYESIREMVGIAAKR